MPSIIGPGFNQVPTNADLGTAAFADAGQFVEINTNTGITILGASDTTPSPIAQTLRINNATGLNLTGASLTIQAGCGTGNGAGGSILPQTASAGGTGHSLRAAATRLSIDSVGNVLATSSGGGLGYGVGSGGTVTQAADSQNPGGRTAWVTLNRPNGAITLLSVAGSTSWQSFSVQNSTVAATDTIIVCQASGTNVYELHVTEVIAGRFRIHLRSTSGTATDAPVINFAVIKAVTS